MISCMVLSYWWVPWQHFSVLLTSPNNASYSEQMWTTKGLVLKPYLHGRYVLGCYFGVALLWSRESPLGNLLVANFKYGPGACPSCWVSTKRNLLHVLQEANRSTVGAYNWQVCFENKLLNWNKKLRWMYLGCKLKRFPRGNSLGVDGNREMCNLLEAFCFFFFFVGGWYGDHTFLMHWTCRSKAHWQK